METITLDKCGTLVNIPPDKESSGPYVVQFPKESYLLLTVGALHGTAAANFDHPNVLTKQDSVFDFKHYRRGGSKFWSSQPGIEYRFAVPKTEIALIMERGLSYVPVMIGGKRVVLNVSGGSNGKEGWADWVHQDCHTCIVKTKSELRAIASVAMTREEAKKVGCDIIIAEKEQNSRNNTNNFVEYFAQKTIDLNIGMKVVLKDGCSWEASQGPFFIKDKYKQKVLLHNGITRDGVWCKRTQISWAKTAEANGIVLRQPVSVNYLETLVPVSS